MRNRRSSMCKKFFISALILFMAPALSGIISARESYEDYLERYDRNRKGQSSVSRDRPLSEIRPGERDTLLDELRGAVREEIDQSIVNEDNKEGSRTINSNKLVEDVRRIVKEEIEDAIKIQQMRYLKGGTVELGGFLSYQARGVDSNEEDNNNILRVYPQLSIFLSNNIAFAVKGEAEFNLTTDTEAYHAGAGPQFVFGITKNDDICFYADMIAGVSRNTSISDELGYRYSNGIGLKFITMSGVIFNMGVQLVFDNLGENATGFQNIIVPTIGITAWF
jgi:hypothetical protein